MAKSGTARNDLAETKDELKPFIDKTYRTLSDRLHTAMVGACQGARVTYHIAERNPSVFGKIGLISPAVYSWGTNIWLYPMVLPKYTGLVWVGGGDAEGHYTPQTRELTDRLLSRGFVPGVDLFYTLTQDAGHHDPYWGAQMIHPLLLFFGKNGSKAMQDQHDHHARIGTPIALELYGDDRLGIGGQPLVINRLLHYDSGFAMTVLDATVDVSPETILHAQADGRIFGLREGVATVVLEKQGLKATRLYHVLPSLSDLVELHLRAHVPETTPDVEKIYFGPLSLERVSTKCYEGRLSLPRAYALIDSFSWDMRKFELRLDGTPMPRRLLRVNTDCTVEYTIERWSQ